MASARVDSPMCSCQALAGVLAGHHGGAAGVAVAEQLQQVAPAAVGEGEVVGQPGGAQIERGVARAAGLVGAQPCRVIPTPVGPSTISLWPWAMRPRWWR